MIVDVHTHLWEQPEQLGEGTAERLRRRPQPPYGQPEAPLTGYEQAMEPVDHAVILGFESRHLGASIPHDLVARYVQRNPGKYLGFAGIDPLADGFLESLQQARELGLVGVTMSPAAQSCHPTHSRAMQLYEQCEKLGMPILFHPGTHLATGAVMEFSQPHLLDEVGRSFPNLKLILAQVGHPWTEPALTLIGKHPNFYADLSDIVARPWQLYNTLLSAYQQDIIDHLLLGSDFPFLAPQAAVVNLFSVNTLTQGTHLPTIPREKLRTIVERDTLACLGLNVPAAAANNPPRPAESEEAAPPAPTPAPAPAEPPTDQPDPVKANDPS